MIKAIKTLKEILAQKLKLNPAQLTMPMFDSTAGIHMEAEEFYNQYNPEDIQKGHCSIVTTVNFNEEAGAAFIMRDMVGCAGILIVHELFVMEDYRRKGIGQVCMDFIKEFAKHYGYAIIQATDLESNAASLRLFEKNGWVKSESFVNPKTKNNIGLWHLKLN